MLVSVNVICRGVASCATHVCVDLGMPGVRLLGSSVCLLRSASWGRPSLALSGDGAGRPISQPSWVACELGVICSVAEGVLGGPILSYGNRYQLGYWEWRLKGHATWLMCGDPWRL